MKKLVCTGICLCSSLCAYGRVTCDDVSYRQIKQELSEQWAGINQFCELSDDKSFADFVFTWIKDFKFEHRDVLQDNECIQKKLLCSYNLLCFLLYHPLAASLDEMDQAWLEDLDYNAWLSSRREILALSDDTSRTIEDSVFSSLEFYKAKFDQDPQCQWADYATKLRHAYRFFRENGLIDPVTMPLDSFYDWIDDLGQKIINMNAD